MTLQNASKFLVAIAGATLRVLHSILNTIAESDRRYREELRLRGVSEEYLRDVGLTRGQIETVYKREARFRLRFGGGSATATPAE